MKKQFIMYFLLLAGIGVFAQTEVEKGMAAITPEAVKGQLEFLASDWTEGRAVGTKGEYIAADYIASMFQVYGIKPFGDAGMPAMTGRRRMMSENMGPLPKTYFQNFSLIQYEPGDEQTFSVISTTAGSESSIDFGYKTDFFVRTGTVGQTTKAPLVFVGYGFEDNEKGYSDLAKINLKGKIAVVLSGFPGSRDTASVAYKKFAPQDRMARFSIERNKAEKLEKAGAIAIIQVNPNADPMAG